MLVLTRWTGQRVRLLLPDGQVIWVGVSDVDRGRVRLSFECPRDIEIAREELLPRSAEGRRNDSV